MADIVFDQVGKSFLGVPAVQSISAQFDDGEFVALLGPSGCGKSTLLRLLAGFEVPTEGRISIGGRDVANADTGYLVAPEDRNIGFVFQSYALWPHMTVRRNVCYPLEVKGLKKADQVAQTDAALAATGLTDYADRMPSELSGGQRQRVALARCLVSAAVAVLLDEPLANLDVALRASMQDVFSDFHQRTGATMVYVTHDQTEAMAMADRIAVMSEGRIVQLDTPEELYNRPRSSFVANFVGEGTVIPIHEASRGENGIQAKLLGETISVAADVTEPNLICVRPENIAIAETGLLRSLVKRCTYLGGRYRLDLAAESGMQFVAETQQRYAEGTQVGLSITTPWAFSEA